MKPGMADWLKSIIRDTGNRPFEKNDQDSVLRSLMSEVEAQVKLAEEEKRMRELSQRRRGSQVDYTWLLSSSSHRPHEIPPLEKLELEELCTKVKPSECTCIIYRFRELVSVDTEPGDIPRVMRGVILELLARRQDAVHSQAGNGSSSRGKSLGRMRASPNKVSPVRGRERMRNASIPNGDARACSVFLVERAISIPMFRTGSLDETSVSKLDPV